MRPAFPLEKIHIDDWGPLEETREGFKHVLEAVCAATEWTILEPVKPETAIDTADMLWHREIARICLMQFSLVCQLQCQSSAIVAQA